MAEGTIQPERNACLDLCDEGFGSWSQTFSLKAKQYRRYLASALNFLTGTPRPLSELEWFRGATPFG
jgi:hypothetical protein